MGLFRLNYENKTNLIFITALSWAINFRTSFKNIDSHMDTGCYSSVKYDPFVILLKNIFCIFFIIGYIYEKKISKVKYKIEIEEENKNNDGENDSIFFYSKTFTEVNGLTFDEAVNHSMGLETFEAKTINYIKIFLLILIIYFSEEVYFIFSNNHILDRIICNMRNFWILIFLLFLSPLIIRKSSYIYKHQLFPSIIILVISLFMILYNVFAIERFKKIFGFNLITYFGSFFLMGLELSLIKYLLYNQFISIYLIVFLKGVIGFVVFGIINLVLKKDDFFQFLDSFLTFEYDYMNDDFEIVQKIGYIFSLILVQFLKIFVINAFNQNFILASMMICDLIYFPLYAIERFFIQKEKISIFSSFVINFCIGIINVLLMLIFNEILECKFLGLNHNIKRNIDLRQNSDYLESKIENQQNLENNPNDDLLNESNSND